MWPARLVSGPSGTYLQSQGPKAALRWATLDSAFPISAISTSSPYEQFVASNSSTNAVTACAVTVPLPAGTYGATFSITTKRAWNRVDASAGASLRIGGVTLWEDTSSNGGAYATVLSLGGYKGQVPAGTYTVGFHMHADGKGSSASVYVRDMQLTLVRVWP
jgi:hypothetical protein